MPPEPVTLREFLEKAPPGTTLPVIEVAGKNYQTKRWLVLMPDILLHCDSNTCNGVRTFWCYMEYPPAVETYDTRIF